LPDIFLEGIIQINKHKRLITDRFEWQFNNYFRASFVRDAAPNLLAKPLKGRYKFVVRRSAFSDVRDSRSDFYRPWSTKGAG
jgi:hypothetical protein